MKAGTNSSTRLFERKEKIISVWEKKVLESAAPTKKMDHPELRNSMPQVLEVMVRILADPNPKQALNDQEKKLAKSHGKSRAVNSNYSLDQVINEYHILRQVIFDFLEEGKDILTPEERDLIWEVFFISIRNAASEFKQVRDEQVKEIQLKLNEANKYLNGAFTEKSKEVILKDQILRTIFDRVEDYALFTLDSRGNISSWACGAQRIKQYTAKDVIGNHYSMLYPPEGRIRDEPEKHLAIAREEGRFRGEGLRQRKDGELFLADVFISPMYEKDELVGYFKIVTDITETNKLLQERDLSRAEVKNLELESVLRERFIYMLTHDLRNPIQAARMSSEMITRKICNVEKHLDNARQSIRHICRVDKMISDLLDASRIREGEPFPLQIEESDLVEIAYEVSDGLATIYGNKFDIVAPATLLGFWDAKGLSRAIENLVTNAVKYGDKDQKITIQLLGVEDRVIIKVHNFGSTLSTQEQKSLFEIFQRSASAKEGKSKGWGLGLTLVRGITEAHGGIVKVRSLPREGTTFTLDLPRDARH